MRELADVFVLPGIGVTLALVFTSAFYFPKDEDRMRKLGLLASSGLWWLETFALWPWISVIIGLFGWLFLWGDRGPPVSGYVLHGISLVCAACVSMLASLRILSGLASKAYVIAIISMTIALLLFIAPYLLWFFAYHGRLPLVEFFC